MRRRVLCSVAAAAAAVLATATMTAAPSVGAGHPASAKAPAKAPRDGRVLYSDFGVGRIATVNPDGSARRYVTPRGGFAFDAEWSPDASHIVYAADAPGDTIRLFTVRRDGTGVHQVTGDGKLMFDAAPTFTPDGTGIVYTRCRPDPPGGCALAFVRTDGTGKKQLTQFSHDPADFYADVSPNGRRVAFARFGAHGIIAQIWVMRIDGSNAHPVTKPALEAASPRWTPDGNHLLVTSLFNHLGENIYRMRADGTQLEQLTHVRYPHNAFFAAPSPSGSRIVYDDDRAYPAIDGGDVFVMRADGSGRHRIVTGPPIGDPDWGTAPLIKGSSDRGLPAGTGARAVPGWLAPRWAQIHPGHW